MSDRLLYTLSTRGRVRFEFFNELLEDVALESQGDAAPGFDLRSQVIRLLDALGHCEFDYERRQVWACPPGVAYLPGSGLSQAVLAGARTPALEAELKKAVRAHSADASICRTPQTFGSARLPAVITITAVSPDLIATIARAAGMQCASAQPAAWRLAAFSSSLPDVIAGLKFTARADLNWPRRTFSSDQLAFSRSISNAEQRLVEYKNPADQQRQHWLWSRDTASEVDRDWGRFIMLQKEGKKVLLYDARKHRAAVPSTIALPPLLARALTLCSGRAPQPYSATPNGVGIPAGRQFHVYSGVPQHVAELASQKLQQELVPITCNDEEATLTPC